MAEGFVQFQKRDATMLIVPARSIIAVKERNGKVVLVLPSYRGPEECEDIELADTMAMVAHKLGVPGGDFERGMSTLVHEHEAMKAGMQTIARMVWNEASKAAVEQARETLKRLGMGW